MRTKFKTIHKVLAASVLMMLGLAACTSDSVVSTNNGQQKGEARQVKFSINTGVKSTTRATAATAADVTALERENTVNKLYAVVFKPSATNTLKPGEFSKTYEVTLTGAGTDNQTYSSATFTMDDDGLYYMYLVANPGTALEKNLTNDTGASAPLVVGTSTVNDFFALVETDRNPNDNSATNFLMTSNVVQVDIQGDGATDLTNGGSRYIELKRAAARIDIDATAIDGFELISVQFVNRHPASVMVNTGTDNALTGESSTSTTNPTYTKPAVDDTYSFTDKWLAGIYGYENHKEAAAGDETGITQLIINGKLNGIAVSQTVDFYSKEETSPGSGTYTYTTIPLNRNTLYYVKLKPKATPDEYAPLAYTIQVANWRTDETIVFAGENLAKACKPELVSIKRQLWDETNNVWADATELNLETVSLNVVDNGTPRTVTDGKRAFVGYKACRLAIKVKAGTTGCNIECPELDEALAGAASSYHTGVTGADKKGMFEGEQSNPEKEYDANGDMYVTWYVQLSEENELGQSFNFTLTNQLNSENDYITHFKLHNVNFRLNPLYYMAESYVKSYDSSTKIATFEPDPKVRNTFSYNIASGMANFSATHAVNHYDDYRSCDVKDGITDNTWHLGSIGEWRSIIPTPQLPWQASSSIFNTGWTSGLRTEPKCYFGYNSETKNTGVIGKSYWEPYTNNSFVRYAIRFLDTDYCSVWKYEFKDHIGIISSRLIDPISSTDTDALTSLMATITAAPDSYWEENSEKGVFQRFLYAGGRRNSNTNGAPDMNDDYTWILTTTKYNNEIIDFVIGKDHNAGGQECELEQSNYSSWGFAIILFKEDI